METTFSKENLVSRNPQILFSVIDNEVVLMDIESDRYVQLDSIASDIWITLSEEMTFGDLCTELLSKYDVNEETCHQNLSEFLKELSAAGYITQK
ncbi:PqqD family protein [Roseivirga pacifica]|uniref:PqqD family protein n=1 Tax=Roseivirga pacifica TaxID=1267423 RepID=UPI003BABBAA3